MDGLTGDGLRVGRELSDEMDGEAKWGSNQSEQDGLQTQMPSKATQVS